jgi:hypothetical protein
VAILHRKPRQRRKWLDQFRRGKKGFPKDQSQVQLILLVYTAQATRIVQVGQWEPWDQGWTRAGTLAKHMTPVTVMLALCKPLRGCLPPRHPRRHVQSRWWLLSGAWASLRFRKQVEQVGLGYGKENKEAPASSPAMNRAHHQLGKAGSLTSPSLCATGWTWFVPSETHVKI